MQDNSSTITPKSNVKIKELNVVESPFIKTTHDVPIFTLDFSPNALIVFYDCYSQKWIVDLGVNFHVTPHKWLSTYVVTHGLVKLGDSH